MKPSLLFLSRWFPYPADNGSKQRIYALLSQLSRSFAISLVSFYEGEAPSADERGVLGQFCADVAAIPYPGIRSSGWKSLRGWFSRYPRMIIERDSPDFRREMQAMAAKQSFDLVIASQIDMAPYALEIQGVPRVLEELEVSLISEGYTREKPGLRRLRRGMTVRKLRRYLAWLIPQFAGVTTVSQKEANQIRRLVPGVRPAWVVPNGVDLDLTPGAYGEPVAGTIIYSGAVTYTANLDAVRYFVTQIFPEVRAQRPEAHISISGSTQGVEISALARRDGVTFLGYVPDVRAVIARSWLSVAPIRQGGGTRLKILEALALGTPVVSTSKGAEGLGLIPERDILIADDPSDFARQVERVLASPALRDALSVNGRKAVEERFGWDRIGADFSEVLIPLVSPARPLGNEE